VKRSLTVVADRVAFRLRRALLRRPRQTFAGARLDPAALTNTLPNSGAVPVAQEFRSGREIVSCFEDIGRRRHDVEGFEGFAADDAIYDESLESWEYWSNGRLAAAVASYAYERSPNPSVLELGCGAAHLFRLLRALGIEDYVGIDGNPWFLRFNPRLRGHEAHFRTLNLQQEIRLEDDGQPATFDIVCSFEVLEHMREDAIDEFLRTVRNHMHPQSTAFLTASLEAGIDVHVLVRDRPWWLERFGRHGLHPRADEEQLRRRLERNHPFNWKPGTTNTFALERR
jgi:SAM-dependent methyltransferase